ncbi:MAG: DNA-binding protein WhiA [Bacilli bacterium]|nr:DNA-binding protein WhiA [Bacilli bacterium]
MKNPVSFAQVVKEELVTNIYESEDRLRALLSAYIRINAIMTFNNKKTNLVLKNENGKVSKFIYSQINSIYGGVAHMSYMSKGNTKKTYYIITIDEASESIMDDLEISFLEGKISKNIVRNDDTISGYLAGAFLASGSINSPLTSNYHLEISLNNENYAKWLSKLFAKYKNSNIEPKIISRRDKAVIYFKKSDQIANFLIMIGAVSACMEFENVRVDRDFANTANRLANGDMANMKKTLEAGKRQAEEMRLIDEKLGIKNIPNLKERELAYMRLENDSLSLIELANKMSEKTGKPVSKSNINHLFISLHKLYERLKG